MPEVSDQLLQAGLSADFNHSYFEPLWIWDEYWCQEISATISICLFNLQLGNLGMSADQFTSLSDQSDSWVEATAQQDFFVEMSTGTGKSLVMADLLASLGRGKACIIVPKLDLMEQLADLLEEMLPSRISRVGTGYPADLSAQLFVCVRNSAWQLQNLIFELQILDEAHHYEPSSEGAAGNETIDGVHAMQVLGLNAKKRVFFSATLLRNKPDFEFGLRPAIEAGVISDYTVMVPILTAGDPRPGLVELIQDLPMSRKILAFCNTVDEARSFTHLLNKEGIAADHYNGHTSRARRHQILQSFGRSPARAGIRVLVTVDVLSEGVDLPCADTCLFVAPRHAVRLRQCVGRVLRQHPGKIDAMVIAPPLAQDANGTALVQDMELGRLLVELAQADPLLRTHMRQNLGNATVNSRICVYCGSRHSGNHDIVEKAARLLHFRVFPSVFKTLSEGWELAFSKLTEYKAQHEDVLVPKDFVTADGFRLGVWLSHQRQSKAKGKLRQERVDGLNALGMVWDPFADAWEQAFSKLAEYKAETGDVIVPQHFVTADGFKLGVWVSNQRQSKVKGKLSQERADHLKDLGMVWDPFADTWERAFSKLTEYKAEYEDVLVPKDFVTADGFKLGVWVGVQRKSKVKGKLCQERVDRLNTLGMVWDALADAWEQAFSKLTEYKAQHEDVLVPKDFVTADGFKLGFWVSNQRQSKVKGRLSQERVDGLNALGMVWDPLADAWEQAFSKLDEYKAQNEDVLVPKDFVTADGFKLGVWVGAQRKRKAKGKLCQERVDRLNALGLVWDPLADAWELAFSKLAEYKAEHGDMLVPQHFVTADGFKLGFWVSNQRQSKFKGRLSQERVGCLNTLGMVWDALADAWEQAFSKLTEYKAQHEDVLVPKDFVTADGFKLGLWVRNQRHNKAKGKLSQERVGRLNALGINDAQLMCRLKTFHGSLGGFAICSYDWNNLVAAGYFSQLYQCFSPAILIFKFVWVGNLLHENKTSMIQHHPTWTCENTFGKRNWCPSKAGGH